MTFRYVYVRMKSMSLMYWVIVIYKVMLKQRYLRGKKGMHRESANVCGTVTVCEVISVKQDGRLGVTLRGCYLLCDSSWINIMN